MVLPDDQEERRRTSSWANPCRTVAAHVTAAPRAFFLRPLVSGWRAEVSYPSIARRESLARAVWALTAPVLIPMAVAVCASDRSA